MNDVQAETRLLVTDCIRKDSLNPTLLVGFPNNNNNQKEHFVQLDVIIVAHSKKYGTKDFNTAVHVLMNLRDHFNQPGNVFCLPRELNKAKRNLTRMYLNGIDASTVPPISKRLHNYINLATVEATIHIGNTPDVNQTFKNQLRGYVDWLGNLKCEL
jgi:hypothetical protein